MTSADIISTLIIGGLLGLLGQGARAAVGLKVMTDYANVSGENPKELFDAVRLVTSMLIGFLVGLAAGIIYLAQNQSAPTGLNALLSFVAAGYIGVDFLEAFINKYIPQPNVTPTQLAKQNEMLAAKLQLAIAANAVDPTALVYGIIHEKQPLAKLTPETKLSDLNYNLPALDSLAASLRTHGVNVDNLTIEGCSTVGDVIACVKKAR